jgi:hypothetical protein
MVDQREKESEQEVETGMRDKVISAERDRVRPWSVKFGSYAKPPRFAAGQRVFHPGGVVTRTCRLYSPAEAEANYYQQLAGKATVEA